MPRSLKHPSHFESRLNVRQDTVAGSTPLRNSLSGADDDIDVGAAASRPVPPVGPSPAAMPLVTKRRITVPLSDAVARRDPSTLSANAPSAVLCASTKTRPGARAGEDRSTQRGAQESADDLAELRRRRWGGIREEGDAAAEMMGRVRADASSVLYRH